MKQLTLFILLVLSAFVSFAQRNPITLEVGPYLRYDRHNEFLSTESPLSSNYVTLRGVSPGIGLNLLAAIKQQYNLSLGIGYYRYSFNNIKRRNTRWGGARDREILFVSPLLIPFFTDKYCYHAVAIGIGAERKIKLGRTMDLDAGAAVTNYLGFSRYYHLTSNPEGSKDYIKGETGYIGTSVLLQAVLLKTFRKISVGPKLIIPVFDILQQDENFPNETNSGSRNKWFNGIGLGISARFLLKH